MTKRDLKRCKAIAVFVLLLLTCNAQAQRVAIKTNTLGWLTASPNIEAEFTLSHHFSLNMSVAGNPLKTDKIETRFVHVQPEVRYWLNRPMVSHFFGITAFNNSYRTLWDDTKRDGHAWAAGVTYGYARALSKHWNFEATVGFGLLRYEQFKYNDTATKPDAYNDKKTTWAPIKLGVSFAYIL